MTPTSVHDGLTLLATRACAAGGVLEVSLLKTSQSVVRGYFAAPDRVGPALATLDAATLHPEGVYITLGAVRPDLLARCGDRFEPWAKTRVSDADVTRRLWLPIDCDPIRPAGISATEDELHAAIARCDDVVAWLCTAHGWPQPVRGSGGNSGHALFAIDLANDAASAALVRQVLEVLDRQFSDTAVKVDTSVFNAARIWTLYGTRKRKGDDTPERPHRRSWIASQPDAFVCVTSAQMAQVAALARPRSRTTTSPAEDDARPVLDMRAAFETRGWYLRDLSGGKHAVTCPWAAEHSGVSGVTETCLFEPREPGGLWGFKCQHAHCAHRTIKDVWRLVRPAPAPEEASAPAPSPVRPVTPCTLAAVDTLFGKWLGKEYDLDALHAVLAVAASEQLLGDPAWLLVISGSGAAKTETVQALGRAGALITSTISSEGALLSASSKQDRAKDATGGLLRRLGARGVLVVKDVTSVLSMNADTRGSLLAAFREVHDGKWERNVGTDGGKTLTWTGRIVVIGACTTAWDRAHSVIASMGDRFVLVRMNSEVGRKAASHQARLNTGAEVLMRQELGEAVAGVLASVDASTLIEATAEEDTRLIEAADVVTLARTGVDYDYRGNVIDSHAPEMPTRFVKQLFQIMRGAMAIGLPRREALRLAIRCARDSMPPMRLAILDDIAGHPGAQTHEVRRRLGKPRATVDRQLQSLHMLGVLTCEEAETVYGGKPSTRWHYSLAAGISPDVLDPEKLPEKPPHTHKHNKEETAETPPQDDGSIPTDISGHFFSPETAELPDDLAAMLEAVEAVFPGSTVTVSPVDTPTCCLDGGALWLRCRGCRALDPASRALAPMTVRPVQWRPV